MKRKEQLDQLREMNADELRDQADALKESLFRLKFRKAHPKIELLKFWALLILEKFNLPRLVSEGGQNPCDRFPLYN